ncbi:hypothetical protein EVAR_22738_1 [Eumeta japonica]|uniref:Uncharacterized protein n=1 Tax=Eumeta variegata TaxID=151549 RepID=A0A4C1UTQ1_EUMVA|nr:hypothetical protein EVAR_22738_1 [Eumeta japonica]
MNAVRSGGERPAPLSVHNLIFISRKPGRTTMRGSLFSNAALIVRYSAPRRKKAKNPAYDYASNIYRDCILSCDRTRGAGARAPGSPHVAIRCLDLLR